MRVQASVVVFVVAIIGCGSEDQKEGGADRSVPVEAQVLRFEAVVAGEPAACDRAYVGLGITKQKVELADARLFLSAIELRDRSGAWQPFQIDGVSPWQDDAVALLDFENQTGACADSGTPEMNAEIHGHVVVADYDAVRFQIAVPEVLNHQNGALAEAPLNVPGMFWTWQAGYKFLRVDWLVAGADLPRFNMHIGASGKRSNRATITLDGFDQDQPIIMDLAALARESDLSENTERTAPGCMAGQEERVDCGPIFRALSLDFETGGCLEGCGKQTVFRYSSSS
jgi:uncharacterized repeat protein (TIGR04052 family)